jgi:hypothetical protein
MIPSLGNIWGQEVLDLAIQQKKVPANARFFEFKHPLLPHPQTMAYVIDGARIRLLGNITANKRRTIGNTRTPEVSLSWVSAPGWAAIAKQYRPIASKLAVELKQLVKVKEGPEPDAETLAKFGPDGKEIPLWPHGIKNDGPTVFFK